MHGAWSIRLVLILILVMSTWSFPDRSISQSDDPHDNAPSQGGDPHIISPYADSPLEAAQKSLEILQSLTIQNLISKKLSRARSYANDLGFQSEAEVPNAKLGPELRIKTVKLQKLKTFKDGDNPADILVDAREYLFPMIVNGQARSSVTVAQRKDKYMKGQERWRWVERGLGKEFKKIEQLKQDIPADFLIDIQGFGKVLAKQSDNKLLLIPIYKGKVGRLDLEAGKEIDASLVFLELAAFLAKAEEANEQQRGGLLR